MLRAQALGLSGPQHARLLELVSTNSQAKHLSEKIIGEADAALKDQGDPIETLATAGLLESDPAKIKSRASLRDMKKLFALACACEVTSQERYSEAASRIILNWAKVNKPTGIPIDETKLEPLFVAYDLIRKKVPAPDREVIDGWLRKIVAAEERTGQRASVTTSNNWQSHRLKIIGLIGFVLEDSGLINQAIDGFKKHVGIDLLADGSSFDFLERDALHYHCYTLEPLLVLAMAVERRGIDLYHFQTASGASLSRSVAFLVPYYRGEKTHLEWVHSKVKFDARRGSAGEKRFISGTPFDPQEARRVLELASHFDGSCRALLDSAGESRFASWQKVLNEVTR